MPRTEHNTELWGHALLATLPDLVFMLDREGRYVDVLAAQKELLVMPQEQLIGKRIDETLPGPVAERCMAAIRGLADDGGFATFHYELDVCGEKHWFECRAALCDAEHIVVIVRDFTDRRRTEEALWRSEGRLAEAQRLAGLGSWDDDRQNMTLTWSDEIYRIFGVDSGSFEPSVAAFFEFIHPDDRRAVRDAFEGLLERRAPFDVTHRIVLRSGEVRWVHERAECFYDAEGAPTRLLGTTQDVTERTLAEQKLQQANAALEHRTTQLRELSQALAATEQHERQHLAAILHDHMQQLLVAAKYTIAAVVGDLQDPKALTALRSADAILETAVQECRSLTIELRPPILREGGLGNSLAWLGRRMRDQHGLDVTVSVQHGPPLDETLQTVMFGAVQELLLNVAKHAHTQTATVDMTFAPAGDVSIIVGDHGFGFDAGAFDADGGSASGFGLLAIRERLGALGGSLKIESSHGAGCRCTLSAPFRAAALAPATPRPAPHPAAPVAVRQAASRSHNGGSQSDDRIRILIVDDHQIMRQGLAKLLVQNAAFHIVGEAADGQAAVALARELRPEAVLMDINMPVMNGVEATRVLHAEFPSMVIIGLSMYKEDHRANEMCYAGASAYVSKDEAADVLITTVLACCRVGEDGENEIAADARPQC